MLPDLESLKCFVAAADLLNFRAAARQVGLSPAALSQRIRSLEEQLETSLFKRTTRTVHLTEAGLALLPTAHNALEAAAEVWLAVGKHSGRIPVDITIGTRHELGLSWVVPMLPDLQNAHPGLTCHTYFGSGADLEYKVRGRQIDCAISSRTVTDPALSHLRLHREEYVLVATPKSLETHPIHTFKDFAEHALIDTNPTLPLFSYFREGSDLSGSLSFKQYLHMGTIEAIRIAIHQNRGIGVLPKYLIEDDIQSGTLVALFSDTPVQHDWFRLIFRKDDPRRTLFESLSETMRSYPLQ